MGQLGMQEIVIIFVLALIVFGPRKLPELGRTIGKGLAEFKKASNELKQTWEEEVQLDKEKAALSSVITDNPVNPSAIVSDIGKSLDPGIAAAVDEIKEVKASLNPESLNK